jgi:hypothetical protein
MLTRSNFEMSSWGLSRTGGQSLVVVGQPDDRLALGHWLSSVPRRPASSSSGLQRAEAEAAARGGEAERQWQAVWPARRAGCVGVALRSGSAGCRSRSV